MIAPVFRCDVFRSRTAERAFGERDDDVCAFHDRRERDALVGAAIFFRDDAVLRVDEDDA